MLFVVTRNSIANGVWFVWSFDCASHGLCVCFCLFVCFPYIVPATVPWHLKRLKPNCSLLLRQELLWRRFLMRYVRSPHHSSKQMCFSFLVYTIHRLLDSSGMSSCQWERTHSFAHCQRPGPLGSYLRRCSRYRRYDCVLDFPRDVSSIPLRPPLTFKPTIRVAFRVLPLAWDTPSRLQPRRLPSRRLA